MPNCDYQWLQIRIITDIEGTYDSLQELRNLSLLRFNVRRGWFHSICLKPMIVLQNYIVYVMKTEVASPSDLRKIELMNNGVEYYFVEVTRENDGQFGIQAFGDEALELFKESTSILQTQVLVDMVSSLYG